MISDENLAQIKALMTELLDTRFKTLEAKVEAVLNKVPSAAAIRMRRYRVRNAIKKKRNDLHREKRNGVTTERNGHELPDWLPVSHWTAFLEMRKRLHKPATQRAQRMLIGRLEELKNKGHSPTQMLAQAELNCWLSFYEPKS